MMKPLPIFIFFLVLSKCCFAQSDDEKTLIKLNHDWISSFVTRDTATMNKIYADDMVLISPSGKTFHKKEMLASLVSPRQQFITANVDTVSVRLFGNIGLVNARATSVAKTDDKQTTVTTCYLDVYEKRNGRWYAVASQVALLSEK